MEFWAVKYFKLYGDVVNKKGSFLKFELLAKRGPAKSLEPGPVNLLTILQKYSQFLSVKI